MLNKDSSSKFFSNFKDVNYELYNSPGESFKTKNPYKCFSTFHLIFVIYQSKLQILIGFNLMLYLVQLLKPHNSLFFDSIPLTSIKNMIHLTNPLKNTSNVCRKCHTDYELLMQFA